MDFKKYEKATTYNLDLDKDGQILEFNLTVMERGDLIRFLRKEDYGKYATVLVNVIRTSYPKEGKKSIEGFVSARLLDLITGISKSWALQSGMEEEVYDNKLEEAINKIKEEQSPLV